MKRKVLGRSLLALTLSAGLVVSISPAAMADPTSSTQTLQDQVSVAQQQLADAQAKAQDLETKLGDISDQHELAKEKHATDLARLTEVRSELVLARAAAAAANKAMGQKASSMYRGNSSTQSLGTTAEALATGDAQSVVDRFSYLRRVGQDAAAVANKAKAEEQRVDRLEKEATDLEASSAKAEADLAAQVQQIQQLNTEAEAAANAAAAALQSANAELSTALQRAATEAERQRLANIQTSLVSYNGGSSADYTTWSNTGTSDWKGYLAKLQANNIVAPSRAQLNNRAAWDPSWQPVMSSDGSPQRGVAQVMTADGPLTILPSETIAALNIAFTKVGIPYLWGGTGPRYDCSGLTMTSYRDAGITLPRVSRAQAASGVEVESMADAMPGDLVYFGSPVHHVGFYLGDGMMLNAPRTGTLVRVEKIWKGVTKITRPSLG